MRLWQRRKGVSALFDALLFFIIVSVACAALIFSAWRLPVTGGISQSDMGSRTSDIMACALEATVGPVNYSAGGQDMQFSGTALGAIQMILGVQSSFQEWNTYGLEGAVSGVLGSLVERPYHFVLDGRLVGRPGGIFISDAPGELSGMSAGRWSCSVPLDVDGIECQLSLYIWR